MSCKPTYKGIRYNSLEELYKANGVNEQQKQQAQQLYSQYLDTIGVTDIGYHHSESDLESFTTFSEGYFPKELKKKGTHYKEADDIVFFVKKPLSEEFMSKRKFTGTWGLKIPNTLQFNAGEKIGEGVHPGVDKGVKNAVDGKYDAVDFGRIRDNKTWSEVVAITNPKNAVKLGSKQDIEGFKEFVGNNVQLNRETISEEKTYKSLSIEENKVKTLANRLSDKFGIKHEFISETKAKQLLGDKYNGESGFYYQGKTYFVKGKLSEKTTIHEFGHPFIDAIFAYNRELFNNLYSKLDRTPEGKDIINLVKSLYPEYLNTKGEIINDDFYKEVMVRSLTEASLNKTSSESKFMAVINKIMHTISKLLRFASNKKGELDKLSVDTTIEELSKLFMSDTKMVLKTSSGETILFNKEGSTQDSIVDSVLKIQKDAKLITENDGKEVHWYNIMGRIFKNTFSQIAKDENQKKSFTKPTENTASKIGTLVHSFAENATKFAVNPDGETAYKESLSLINRAIYLGVKIRINSLIKNITDEDAKNGLGTPRFLSEVTIFDNTLVWYDADGKKHTGGAAGTIDLLVVHTDGSVSIYDFKTSKYDTMNAKSLAIYDRQLSLMKQTLAKGIPMYGLEPITKFKKTRLIPIKVSYAKNKTTGEIELSNATFANDQIPVAGESTGNKSLDDKLKDWTNKLNNMLKHQYDGDELVKAERAKKIVMLRSLLTKLNIKKNIVDVLDDIEALVSQIEVSMSKKTEDLTNAEINAHREDLKAYVNISVLANLDIDNKDKLRIEQLTGRVDSLMTLINRRNEDIITKAMSAKGYDSNEVAFGITGYEANFRELSQYNNPHLNYFYRQVQGKLNQTRIDSDKFREKLVDVTEKLKKFASSHGGTGEVFDWMINQSGSSLRLISKLSDEFFKARDKAIENKDEEWLKENVHLDLDAIKAEYKRRVESNPFDPKLMSKQYASHKADADAFWNKNKSLKTASKKYLIVNDNVAEKWHSKEYSKLLQKGNEPALNFYNFYVNSMNEFKKFLPDVGQGESFMAQIRADFIEQTSKLNKDSLEYTKEMAREMVSFRQNEDITMGVYENGQRSYTVPVFYTQKIDASRASKDLARSLQMFAEMAYKYRAMSELEAESISILESLKTKKAYETTWTGNVVTKSGEKVTSEEANKKYVDAMVDYMNYYLYGITTKEQGPIGPIVKTLSNWNAKAKLSFNLMSGAIAWTANAIGLIEETIKSTYFSGEDFRKASLDLSSANTEGYAIMRFFEPNSETAFKTKGGKGTREMLNKKLSKYYILGAVNPDLMFEALRSADRFAFGSVTLAMARNHTIDSNGNIVSFKTIRRNKLPMDFYDSNKYSKEQRASIEKGIEEYLKTLPTIRDSVVYKDGEMSFKGNTPTDEAILGFKNKIREVVRNTTGSIDNDNVSRARMSAMWRAGMLFKNWMPRAYDKRYGALRKNIVAESYELGRYRTFFGKMFSKVTDDAGEAHIALTMGVEKYAIMKYNELVINGLDKGITQNEFVELTKANIKASIYGIAISGLAIIGVLALAHYEDDDDEKNAVFLQKYLKRNVSELMMWVNPQEFINIFKSPTVIIAPLDETVKFMKAIAGETYGQTIGDETIIRRNNPLYYLSKMAPGGAFLRTMMDGSKEVERFMKSRDEELIGD